MISIKSMSRRLIRGSSVCEMLVAVGLMATCLTPVVTPWVSLASKTRTVKETAQDIRRMRFGLEAYQRLEAEKLFAMAGMGGVLPEIEEAVAASAGDETASDSKIRARLIGEGAVRRLVIEIAGKPGLKLEALVDNTQTDAAVAWQPPASLGAGSVP